MPRKKTTPTFVIDEPKGFDPRNGKMIVSEVMYSDVDKSTVVGIAMSGELVTILDIKYDKDMTKIKTKDTNRIGFVNSKSVI